jgi:hypothetical protein
MAIDFEKKAAAILDELDGGDYMGIAAERALMAAKGNSFYLLVTSEAEISYRNGVKKGYYSASDFLANRASEIERGEDV